MTASARARPAGSRAARIGRSRASSKERYQSSLRPLTHSLIDHEVADGRNGEAVVLSHCQQAGRVGETHVVLVGTAAASVAPAGRRNRNADYSQREGGEGAGIEYTQRRRDYPGPHRSQAPAR